MEQAAPFLIALFIHAALVDARTATRYGWVWLGSRALYPFVFRMPFPGLLVSTVPAYCCILYMLFTAVRAVQ